MKTRWWIALAAMVFSANAVAAKFWMREMTEAEFDQKLDSSPFVKLVGKARFEPQPPGTQIEVHYTRFGLMHVARYPSEPNAHHYIMGAPSEPKWKSVKIAEIDIWRTMRADPIVIAEMKKRAVALGGNALVDCHREPVRLDNSEQRVGQSATTVSMDVAGYVFHCDVVRRKD